MEKLDPIKINFDYVVSVLQTSFIIEEDTKEEQNYLMVLAKLGMILVSIHDIETSMD